MGGARASRSHSAGQALGFRRAQEALASNCGWSSRAQLRELAAGVGQPGPSDLRAQTAEGGGENEFNVPAGAGANAGAGPSLRIGSDVPSCAISPEISRIVSQTSWNFGLERNIIELVSVCFLSTGSSSTANAMLQTLTVCGLPTARCSCLSRPSCHDSCLRNKNWAFVRR